MYLSTFRKHGIGPGNWGTAAWWSGRPIPPTGAACASG